jgi:hypothetical protein
MTFQTLRSLPFHRISCIGKVLERRWYFELLLVGKLDRVGSTMVDMAVDMAAGMAVVEDFDSFVGYVVA